MAPNADPQMSEHARDRKNTNEPVLWQSSRWRQSPVVASWAVLEEKEVSLHSQISSASSLFAVRKRDVRARQGSGWKHLFYRRNALKYREKL